MGFSLLSPPANYDASGLGGITFWMKSNVPVEVQVPTSETASINSGGQCVSSATPEGCELHFSFQITAPAEGWAEYFVPFNALRAGGSALWNPRHILNVNFQVPSNTVFDVWIDDVAFYACAGPECQPTCTDPRFRESCRIGNGSRSSCQPTGTDCADVASWCTDQLLIDNMEDGNSAICESGGRRGGWYTVGDGTPNGEVTPKERMDFRQTSIPSGREKSHFAARMSGSGFTDVGALLGVGLVDGQSQPYDASKVSGIKFWMKNSVPISVLLHTVETLFVADGGECVEKLGEYNCNNNFSFKVTAPNNDWVLYELPFSAFSQTAGTVTWNPSHLRNIGFAAQRDTTFDVWVDDLQFYNCSASPCLPTCADPAFPVQCAANAQSPAGCRRKETDCATFVLGCGASNTTRAPADGMIATFMDMDSGTDIVGGVVAVGEPAPTYTTDGTLHITLNTSAPTHALLVADRFASCIDAAVFTGVQFSISGFVSGCTLGYFTEDSIHLYDDGDPRSHASHGIGRPGALPPVIKLAAGQITSAPQTLSMPFAAQLGGIPNRPINTAKVTGFGWMFFVDPSNNTGTAACVADLTIDDVRFY
jgi:hypothetical protein